MKKVYITKGLPASGKSTWAKELIAEKPNVYKRINKDDLRAMLDAGKWTKNNEKFVLKVRDMIILEALKDGKHVIVDDTNLHERHEIRIKDLVKEYTKETGHQVHVEVKFFDVPLAECIKRDLQRPHSVGEAVIRRMHKMFLTTNDDPRGMYRLAQDETLPKAIICDLDGTLALLNRNPFDASTCDQDLLNTPVANVVKNYKNLGYEIILLSGRQDKYKEPTLVFLEKHEIPFDQLIMRRSADQRKDRIIKKEIFDNQIKGKWFVEFILDDRNQVVDMWREEGLVCYQVAPGDF